MRDFSAGHPEVALRLHQGSPKQVAQMLLTGEADIGVATEALAQYAELVALPCYRWTHAVVVPPRPRAGCAGGGGETLTLERLARFPIITYESRLHRPHPHRRSLRAPRPGARTWCCRRWTPT